jgi:thioredoxin-like negative regulator of GroEL
MKPTTFEPRETSDGELPALLRRSAEPVVVESHHAGWAKPWQALSSEARTELAREFGERVVHVTLETGANRETAVRYGLEVIPVVLVFAGGQVVARFTGSVRSADVIAAVRSILRRRASRAPEPSLARAV